MGRCRLLQCPWLQFNRERAHGLTSGSQACKWRFRHTYSSTKATWAQDWWLSCPILCLDTQVRWEQMPPRQLSRCSTPHFIRYSGMTSITFPSNPRYHALRWHIYKMRTAYIPGSPPERQPPGESPGLYWPMTRSGNRVLLSSHCPGGLMCYGKGSVLRTPIICECSQD